MKRLFLFLVIAACGFSGWYYWNNKPHFLSSFTGEEFTTFKMRHSIEGIIERHQKDLLKKGSTFLEPGVTYFPYLLMEVKYSIGEESKEGVLLWGLADGEMVVNVEDWERTHGFEDCLMSKVDAQEFKIIRALAEGGGLLERGKLGKECLEEAIESCKEKKLIAEKGGKLRLHLQDPKLELRPHTELDEMVVTLPHFPKKREKKEYSISEVVKLAHIAFGEDFAIRREREVYLPVFEIVVQHADGSVMRTYWNALTGERVAK